MSNNKSPDLSQPALSADEIAVVSRLEAKEAVAAARAELDRLIDRRRSLKIEVQKVDLAIQSARENLRKAQANTAPKPQSLQDAMKAARARYCPPQSDPATVKANKKARQKKYMEKLKADPVRYAEHQRVRNERQNRRRAEKRRH